MNSSRLLSRLLQTDWDFSGEMSGSPFSSIHWHPARFASQLPAALIGLLSSERECVLDPFVGSGTTLAEAQRLNRRAVGFDVNPVACLIAEAKTLPIGSAAVNELVDVIIGRASASAAMEWLDSSEGGAQTFPPSVQAKKWYSPGTRRQLLAIWRALDGLEAHGLALARAAFSASLIDVCRETRHWGYICDNSTPRSHREIDALQQFISVLTRFREAYRQRDAELKGRFGEVRLLPASVQCGDARELLAEMGRSSVDLVVTSPPYFGVCDYVKAQRLSAEWFGIDIESFRLKETGARSKRHRISAWADYVSELVDVLGGLRRCLKPGKFCVLVIGESRERQAVLEAVRSSAVELGYGLFADINRRVSSQRRQAPSIHGEHIFILRR